MIQASFPLLAFAAVLLQITFSSPVEWDENASRQLDQELRDRLTVIEAELESIAKAVSEKADEAEAALQHAAEESDSAKSQRVILRTFFPLVAEVEGEDAEDEDFETDNLAAEEDAEALEAEESAAAPTDLAANEIPAEDLLNGAKEPKESAAAPAAGGVESQEGKRKAKVPEVVAKKAAKKAAAKKKKQKGLSGASAGKRKKAKKSKGKKAKKEKKSKKGKKKGKKAKKGKKGKKKQKGLSAGTRGLNQKEIDQICESQKGLFNTVHSVAETRQLADQVSRLTDSFKTLKDAIAIARPSVFAPKQ